MISARLDTKKFDQIMLGLHDALIKDGRHGDANKLLKQQTRLFSLSAVQTTPPKNRKQGAGAVSSDLKHLFTAVNDDLLLEVGSEYGRDNIDGWITKKDGSVLNLIWDTIADNTNQMASVHRKYRSKSSGRVRTGIRPRKGVWQSRAVVSHSDRKRYIRDKQKMVGWLKASWAEAAIKLGQTRGITSFVRKHHPSPDSVLRLGNINRVAYPEAIVGSNAGGNRRIEDKIHTVFAKRLQAMARQTRLILRNYKRDAESGRRPRSKVKAITA